MNGGAMLLTSNAFMNTLHSVTHYSHKVCAGGHDDCIHDPVRAHSFDYSWYRDNYGDWDDADTIVSRLNYIKNNVDRWSCDDAAKE